MNMYLQDYGYSVKILATDLSPRKISLSAAKILCEPMNIYYAVIMYNFALGLLFEMEASICVFGLMFQNPKVAWSSVIFLEDRSKMFDISHLDFGVSRFLKEKTSETSGQPSAQACL